MRSNMFDVLKFKSKKLLEILPMIFRYVTSSKGIYISVQKFVQELLYSSLILKKVKFTVIDSIKLSILVD